MLVMSWRKHSQLTQAETGDGNLASTQQREHIAEDTSRVCYRILR